jgi:hypothetical protein
VAADRASPAGRRRKMRAVPGLGLLLQACDTNAIRMARRCPRFSAVYTYRNAAAGLAVWAACLSLAACSAGITTTSSVTADAAQASRSAAAAASSASAAAVASASASASRAAAGRMIKVAGLSVSVPVPTGAKVIENMDTSIDSKQQAGIFFILVTPAKVASFYTKALPQDGYKITSNSLISQSASAVAFIQFSGHGIKGTIDSLAKFPGPNPGIPGLGRKNVTTVTITQQ